MKTALCLSGIVGGESGKNGLGNTINYVECNKYFKENIIEPNGCDVFIHSWSTKYENDLLRLYKPKGYVFEEQKQFSTKGGNRFRFQSKWYSVSQSLLKMKEFGKYDWVIVSRFDILFLTALNVDLFDSKYLYVSNYSAYPVESEQERWEIPPKNNSMSLFKKKIHDVYFIMSYENILKFVFSKPKKWYYNSSPNPHRAIYARIMKVFDKGIGVVKYWGHRGYDWDLYRWRICHSNK